MVEGRARRAAWRITGALLLSLGVVLLWAGVAAADESSTGTITVVLDASPDDGQDFTFTGCQGPWCGPFTLDDDTDPASTDRRSAAGLAPGTYTVTQAADATWALTSISCTTGESISLANRRVTITLTAGEQTTCTFRDTGTSITVVQDTSPDDGQDFSFQGCLGSGCAPFVLDDDADPGRPSSITAVGLAPGTYTVTQDLGPPTLPLSGLSCTTGESVSVGSRRATITLSPGEQVRCTFTNTLDTRPGQLTVVADTRPDGPADVVVHRCGDDGCTDLTLDDDGRPDLPRTTGAVSLPPGSYTLTVDPVPGHELFTIACGWSDPFDPTLRRATVRVDPNRSVTCTVLHRVPPPALQDVAEISAGAAGACVRRHDGTARCWGVNQSGQVGDGSVVDTPVPVEVLSPDGSAPLDGVTSISTGFSHACAAVADGQARCWGYGWDGGLGNGTNAQVNPLPVVVSDPEGTGALTDVATVGAGGGFSCALLTTHEARCWGANDGGQLGDGTTTDRPRPVVVRDEAGSGPLGGITQVEVGGFHACALLDSGQARCWGDNTEGRLGDGTTTDRSRPVAVTNEAGTGPLTGITAIAAGYEQTCALLESGQARCWGSSRDGLLGNGDTTSSARPVAVSDPVGAGPLAGIVQLGSGGAPQMCATIESGEAYCWGDNEGGLLGDGTTTDRHRPTLVSDAAGSGPLTGVVAVAPGVRQTCARLASGEARCWGRNHDGRLGDGTTATHLRPTPVIDPYGEAQPFTGAVRVSAGAAHTCAIDGGHRAWCWGSNAFGALANPDVGLADVPTPVLDPAGTGPLTGWRTSTPAGTTRAPC